LPLSTGKPAAISGSTRFPKGLFRLDPRGSAFPIESAEKGIDPSDYGPTLGQPAVDVLVQRLASHCLPMGKGVRWMQIAITQQALPLLSVSKSN
jgi:hypothetical protein